MCFEAGKKTIEIGVGTGIFAERLGIKEGIEPSSAMAKLAKDRGISIIKGYAEDIPLDDNVYQQVFMITVDCFLTDINKAFSEVKRILESGGIFTIAIINKATELGQIYEKNKKKDAIYKWADFRSADETIKLLESHNFKIVEIYQTVTDFEDKRYDVKKGHGDGVFTVIKAISK